MGMFSLAQNWVCTWLLPKSPPTTVNANALNAEVSTHPPKRIPHPAFALPSGPAPSRATSRCHRSTRWGSIPIPVAPNRIRLAVSFYRLFAEGLCLVSSRLSSADTSSIFRSISALVLGSSVVDSSGRRATGVATSAAC